MHILILIRIVPVDQSRYLSFLSLIEKGRFRKIDLILRVGNIGLKCTIFALVPLFILLFYGIEDKNVWFFGHEYINDYRYRIQCNVVYHVGVMVSHYSL